MNVSCQINLDVTGNMAAGKAPDLQLLLPLISMITSMQIRLHVHVRFFTTLSFLLRIVFPNFGHAQTKRLVCFPCCFQSGGPGHHGDYDPWGKGIGNMPRDSAGFIKVPPKQRDPIDTAMSTDKVGHGRV